MSCPLSYGDWLLVISSAERERNGDVGGGGIVVTSWGRAKSCTFGFMFVMCQIVFLASGCAGKNDVADVALGVRALGCAMVSAAV